MGRTSPHNEPSESAAGVLSEGGKIIRILCDRNPVPNPQVCAAAKNMVEAGIEVAYYNLASWKVPPADYSFNWDYAIVDETGDAAVWNSFASSPGGVIVEAIYTNKGEYKGKDLRDLWQTVRAVSNPIPIAEAATTR